MARKMNDHLLGERNSEVGNMGPLEALLAAEAAERGDPPRRPKNKEAIKEDPRWVIRIGLRAEE